MFRNLFAAVAAASILFAAPAMAQPAYDAPFTVAAKASSDGDRDDKKLVANNRMVAFNTKTKIYHLKGCQHYDNKNCEKMKAKEARDEGGKACKLCIKKK